MAIVCADPNVVLDTNIVLDCWVFDDPAAYGLRDALLDGRARWLATASMREELARVLTYPQIAQRLAHHGRHASAVLAQWDQLVNVCETAPKAPVTCKDADDQGFIDLAVAYRCMLISKDHAVLCMQKRLLALGVRVASAVSIETTPSNGVAP